MPLYIKIDFPNEPKDGRIYAWINSAPIWNGIHSGTFGASVPQLLRKLAKQIEENLK
jgi:hypothetical protein